MSKYLATLIELKRDEKGVTALEYGLIAALIAVIIIGSISTLGVNLSTMFASIATKTTAATTTMTSHQ